MSVAREHAGHRGEAMIRIVEAREKYETRKLKRHRQRYRVIEDAEGNVTGVWESMPGDESPEKETPPVNDDCPGDPVC